MSRRNMFRRNTRPPPFRPGSTPEDRINLIVSHRQLIHRRTLGPLNYRELTYNTYYESQPKVPLRPITFKDIRHWGVQHDSILECKIVDEPLYFNEWYRNVGVLVEDGNQEIGAITISNISPHINIDETIGYGCDVGLINLFFNSPEIFLNSTDFILPISTRRDLDRCRVCGRSQIEMIRCNFCKAKYCSQTCANCDILLLGHQFVCATIGY